jgi:16S rRNA (adenine(1408)-N(1))-methyltransferase
VIGIDASAAGMAEASRRAARPARKGGLPNALFVVAAAEALPAELDGCADALTVHFPWGSLLRGLLSANATVLCGLARVTRPGADLTLLLSVTPRDNVPGMAALDEAALRSLAGSYANHGLALTDVRPATMDDLDRSHSTWAKRLQAEATRAVWCVRFCRVASDADSSEPTGRLMPGLDVTARKETA